MQETHCVWRRIADDLFLVSDFLAPPYQGSWIRHCMCVAPGETACYYAARTAIMCVHVNYSYLKSGSYRL